MDVFKALGQILKKLANSLWIGNYFQSNYVAVEQIDTPNIQKDKSIDLYTYLKENTENGVLYLTKDLNILNEEYPDDYFADLNINLIRADFIENTRNIRVISGKIPLFLNDVVLHSDVKFVIYGNKESNSNFENVPRKCDEVFLISFDWNGNIQIPSGFKTTTFSDSTLDKVHITSSIETQNVEFYKCDIRDLNIESKIDEITFYNCKFKASGLINISNCNRTRYTFCEYNRNVININCNEIIFSNITNFNIHEINGEYKTILINNCSDINLDIFNVELIRSLHIQNTVNIFIPSLKGEIDYISIIDSKIKFIDDVVVEKIVSSGYISFNTSLIPFNLYSRLGKPRFDSKNFKFLILLSEELNVRIDRLEDVYLESGIEISEYEYSEMVGIYQALV